MGRLIAALILAVPLVLVGIYLVNNQNMLMGGAPEVDRETDLITDAMPDAAWNLADDCDAGKSGRCWELGLAYAGGKLGLPKSIIHTRRLCQKACEMGEKEACRLWEIGAPVCPISSK